MALLVIVIILDLRNIPFIRVVMIFPLLGSFLDFFGLVCLLAITQSGIDSGVFCTKNVSFGGIGSVLACDKASFSLFSPSTKV